METLKELNILGFNISAMNVEEIVEGALHSKGLSVVNTINPHSYAVQKKDFEFREALIKSDILIPDGVGIVYALKILRNRNVSKIAGYDLFLEVMKRMEREKGSVFFLGSSNYVLDGIRDRALRDFPNVVIRSHSPDFKERFNEEDIIEFHKIINDASPDVLFVGLTAPKQEKLILNIKPGLNKGVKIASGIGAVFDFYAGTVKRPGNVWVRLHLEWLGRLFMEPKRMWKRVFVSTPIFLFDVLKAKFNNRSLG